MSSISNHIHNYDDSVISPASVNDSSDDTWQLLTALKLNILVCIVLIGFFELNRSLKGIYLKRLTRKFEKSRRVPDMPKRYLLGWFIAINRITEEELLRMVGLDGYMLIRYINICFRMSLFVTIWGILVLAPVYSIAGSPSSPIIEWNRYTIANISNTTERIQIELWVPSLFVYIFSSYFCYLMYNEYKHFALHRIEYLIFGDDDTPEQTYYTVLVEKLPGKLRTELELTNFFEKLFPNDVHSVEIALDLDELDILIAERKNVRNHLEKSIAILKGTSRRSTVYIHSDFYKDISEPLVPLSTNRIISWFGYNRYDAIHHYNRVLQMLNDDVADQQRLILHNIEHGKQMDRNRVREEEEEDNQDMYTRHTKSHASTATSSSINSTRSHAAESYTKSVNSNSSISASESSDGLVSIVERFFDKLYGYNSTISKKYDSSSATTAVSGNGTDSNRIPFETYQTSRVSYSANTMSANGVSIVQSHAYTHDSIDTNDTTASTSGSVGALDIFPSRIMSKAVEGVEGLSKKALKGALKGMLEATRTLELLTVGAYYRTSTTAFVTLKSRVSTNLSHQMLLSHEHNVLQVVAAPNPKDIIVDNISLPRRQINTRIYIADGVLIVGAIFWSFVVGFIATISNLETISKERGWEWLQSYNKTTIFIFLNNYLALGLLLVLLATLPVLFDIIARNYEGLKLESEIQNSIMNRYFYYQLANVFVSVGLGSLASSLHQILNKPSSIFNILGSTVPSFSTYFANLLVVKSFTAVPIEMLRLYSLFEYLSVKTCVDKRTCTRRELRTGAFADPPMLYGWIYPNLLMVLMIMLTYCCIAPLLMPFCMIFFAFAYAMYKYQLLYVYINDYQSGGYMWYAVFKHSMVGLICGVVTLICYMGIRDSVNSGPFYLITPLPVFIIFFWRYCEAKYKLPSMHLSLESAIDIDHIHSVNRADGKKTPQDAFSKYLFRQSSLREGPLEPEIYRTRSMGASSRKASRLSGIDDNGVELKQYDSTRLSNISGITYSRKTAGDIESKYDDVYDNITVMASSDVVYHDTVTASGGDDVDNDDENNNDNDTHVDEVLEAHGTDDAPYEYSPIVQSSGIDAYTGNYGSI